MISIRPAVSSDVKAVCSFDLIARQADDRRELIRRAVNEGTFYTAVAEQDVIGYGVLTRSAHGYQV
jgi:hypothetical protein